MVGTDEQSGAGAEDEATLEPEGAAVGARDWQVWLDGRPRRLTRGKHYTGDSKAVAREARKAATRLGRTAVASRDSQGKYDYIWIQFVDGEVEPGRPCPLCGGTTLEKVQKHFLRCSTCGRTLWAKDEWEVAAGTYPTASSEPLEDADEDDVPGTRPRPRGNEHAEILRTRLLAADGAETVQPSLSEDFTLAVEVRFLRPVEWALPSFVLAVRDVGAALRIDCPRPVSASVPETVEARVRVPSHLLVAKDYTVETVVALVPEAAVKGRAMLADRNALTFRAVEEGTSAAKRAKPWGEYGSPFPWEVEARPNDPSVPGPRDSDADAGREPEEVDPLDVEGADPLR